MAQTMINFRIDEEVKKKMESACKEIGLSLSTAFNIFAVKVGNERRILFEIIANPFYSEQNILTGRNKIIYEYNEELI